MKKIVFFLFIIVLNVHFNNAQTANKIKIIDEPISGWYKIQSSISLSNLKSTNLSSLYSDLFYLPENNLMVFERKETDNNRYVHYRYFQTYKGIRIENSAFYIHEKNNLLYSANGVLCKTIDLNTIPTLTEKEAWNKANITLSNKLYSLTTANIVILSNKIFPQLSTNYLAYKYFIQLKDTVAAFDIYIDAHSGKELMKISKLFTGHSKGVALTRYSGRQEIITDHFSSGFRLINNNYKNRGYAISVKSANFNWGNQNITDFIDKDNYWNNINKTEDEAATDLFWGAGITSDYFFEKFGRISYDNKAGNINCVGHFGNGYENAFWFDGTLYFGVTSLYNLDIVAHEFTHGVTEYSANLIYNSESGALNEAFSDIFSSCIESYAAIHHGDSIWINGEFFLQGGLRNIKDPKSLGLPSTYKGEYWYYKAKDNQGVHTNNGPFTYWFYLLAKGGQGINDLQRTYNVDSIGIDNAAQIAYRMLTVYLIPSSVYKDAYMASLWATEDLFGYNSTQYRQVLNAWYAIGLGEKTSKNDVGISSIISPFTSCKPLSALQQITVNIKHFGDSSQFLAAGTVIPLRYKVNGDTSLIENITLTKNLKGGSYITYSFNNKYDFLDTGEYSISAWTLFPNDSISLNNIKSTFVYSGKDYGQDNDLLILSLKRGDVINNEASVIVQFQNNGCDSIPIGSEIKMNYKFNNNLVIKESLFLSKSLKSKEIHQFIFTKKVQLKKINILNSWIEFNSDPIKNNDSLEIEMVHGTIDSFPYFRDFDNNNADFKSDTLNKFLWQWGHSEKNIFQKSNSKNKIWCTNLTGFYPLNTRYSLETPCFNLTSLTHPDLSFDMILNTEKSFDGMILQYSIDKLNWINLNSIEYDLIDTTSVLEFDRFFTGYLKNWRRFYFNLDSLKNSTKISFRFLFVSDPYEHTDGIAIDNFRIGEIEHTDLMVKKLISPISGLFLNNIKPTVLLYNIGYDTIKTFHIYYKLNNQIPFDTIVQFILNPLDSMVFTFSSSISLQNNNKNYLTIYTSLQKDQNPINDTISNIIIDLPYTENFENDNGGFNNELASEFWNWGIPKTTDIKKSSSGQYVWMTNNYMTLNPDRIYYLVTLPYDFTNLTNPSVSFDIFGTLTENSILQFEYSTDNKNWSKILIDEIEPTQIIYSDWTTIKVSLPELNGLSKVFFRFSFQYLINSTSPLIAIDNFSINELNFNNVAITKLDLPKYIYNNTDPIELIVSYDNYGKEIKTLSKINYSIDNGPVITENIDEIFYKNNNVYYFNTLAFFPSFKKYIIRTWINIANDIDTTDNVRIDTIDIHPKVNLPCIEEFEITDTTDFFIPSSDYIILDSIELAKKNINTSNKTHFIYNNTNNSKIFTHAFNLTQITNPKIDFDITGINEDILNPSRIFIYYSSDNGLTWKYIWDWNLNNTWQHISRKLSGISNSENIQFAFCLNSNASSKGFCLDNISISSYKIPDIAISNLFITSGKACLDTLEKLFISVNDVGADSIKSAKFCYRVNNGSWYCDSVDTLNIFKPETPSKKNSYTHTFTKLAKLTDTVNIIEAYVALHNEIPDQFNSKLIKVKSHKGIEQFPFFEDFENIKQLDNSYFSDNWLNVTTDGNDWWCHKGKDNDDDLNYLELIKDHTTNTDTGTFLYNFNRTPYDGWGSIVTTCMDLSKLKRPTLDFYYFLTGGNASIDLNILVNGEIYKSGIWFEFVNHWISPSWKKATINLPRIKENVQLQFNGGVIWDELTANALDDIRIYDSKDTFDLSILEMPQSGCLDTVNRFKVKLLNIGYDTIKSAITIQYNLDNQQTVFDTLLLFLAPQDTFSYNLKSEIPLSAGEHSIKKILFNLMGDVKPENNQFTNYSFNIYKSIFKDSLIINCLGDDFVLNTVPNNHAISFEWKKDSLNTDVIGNLNRFFPDTSGKYYVTITFNNNCILSDSIYIDYYKSLPVSALVDIAACDSYLLDPGIFSSYLWGNESNNRYFIAKNTGGVILTYSDTNNCYSTDSINAEIIFSPNIELGPDIYTKDIDTLLLTADFYNDVSYLWNTNETNNQIIPLNYGTYYLTVTRKSCESVDSIKVYMTSSTLDEIIKDQVKIYPNPVSDLITIELNSAINLQNALIFIYDMNGKKLLEQKMNHYIEKVNISSIITNEFVLKIKTQDWEKTLVLLRKK